jgi:hypothetical protein
MQLETILIAVIPSLLAVVSAYITVKFSTRGQGQEREASAGETTVNTAITLMHEMEEKVAAVERRCEMLEAESSSQHSQIMVLRRRVRVMSSYAYKLVGQLEKIGVTPDVSLDDIEKALNNGY